MTVESRPFDPAEYLTDAEGIAAYLNDAFASGDAGEIADALGVVARARGMTDLAKRTGLGRQALYRSLSAGGRPELPTLQAVLHAFGLRLAVAPIEAPPVEAEPQNPADIIKAIADDLSNVPEDVRARWDAGFADLKEYLHASVPRDIGVRIHSAHDVFGDLVFTGAGSLRSSNLGALAIVGVGSAVPGASGHYVQSGPVYVAEAPSRSAHKDQKPKSRKSGKAHSDRATP